MNYFKLISALLIGILITGCSEKNSEQKMFEISDRQMEFNEFKVNRIIGMIEKLPSNEINKAIIENCNSFHSEITAFQSKLAGANAIGEIREEINSYLNDYLQKVNPELNHENYLDGAISKGLLSIELAYIEKSFLEDQEFQIERLPVEFDQIQVHLIPEKAVVKDGEKIKVKVLIAATPSKSDPGIKIKYVNDGESSDVEGGMFELDVKADGLGLNQKEMEVEVELSDTTYRPMLKYWVIK
ncbi:MAG: hypothetical protein AAFN93_05055 [Bacteroidota bacterium]